ncbi:hypothetical protein YASMINEVIRUS_701 [Yasminevirus sp. GU-2018]|uniref:Uncharacterized protein n=1 Tax=Yasminevirus sp. GU-2018 TaxID=2420051 RepID=A0A5K0U880_9VIRU|nr:hypothetical protein YASMINEVIRUS_701 [Yasminevirus sp. GU-2018]
MASKTSLKDFEPFFGGDQKGAFLVQAMFNGTNYTDRTGLNSGLMIELLRAENYKNFGTVASSVNGQRHGADDVHQDVTDLIITTALFHRSIDQSSTAGTNLGDAINRISSAVTEFLNVNPAATPRTLNSVASQANQDIPTAYGLVAGNYSNGVHLLHLLADRAVWDAQTNGANQNLSGRQDVHGRTQTTAINQVVDCAVVAPVAPGDMNLCWGAVAGQNPDASSALAALEAAGVANARATITNAIQDELRNVLQQIIRSMKAEMLARYPTLGSTPNNPQFNQLSNNNNLGNRSIATVQAFLDPATRSKYLQMIRDLSNAGVPRAIKNVVNTTVAIPHTTLAVADAKAFFDKVYSAWPTMSADIKQFYGQNISIFAKTGSPLVDTNNDQYRKQALAMDWVRLTPSEVDALFRQGRSLTPAELGNLRVNLMKSQLSGNKDVLFGSNLPDVPSGSNVWYTQNNGTYGHVIAPPADFLRRLYSTVYSMAGPIASPFNINITYTNPVLNLQLTNVESVIANRPKGPFNLNIGKFTAAAIRREDDQIENQVQQQTGPVDASLDAYSFLTAYDMVYGQLWTFDTQKGQYYRVDAGNKRVYYDDAAKGDTRTCYASYLGKGSDPNCLRVIQCIADGNSKSLNRCLDVIGDGDLWEVAADDVQKVGPDMVKLVLRKFGVKGYEETDSNGVKYKVPMSYDEWENLVVANFPDDVKNTIKSNNRLKTYIKGLIGVCRSNPNILNRNNPSIVARDNTPDYIRNLNMRKYKIPSVSRKTQYEFFAEQLRNAVQPTSVDAGWFNPITSGSFSNIMFVNPYTTPVPAMLGGGFYAATVPSLISRGTGADAMERQAQILKNGSASMFASLLATITNALADTGIQLHSDDKARLLGVVKKLENYETQLAKMCSVLINIVKIARFYGVSLENVDKDHLRVMKLSDLHTVDDIRDFVRGYARELTKNMITNMSIQQAAAYELMSKAGPRLIDDCTGRSDSSAPSVSSRQLVSI